MQDIFVEALENMKENSLFMIVPVKCETYIRQNPAKLFSKVTAKFSEFIELARGKHRGRSAVVIMPVNILGGARFTGLVRDVTGRHILDEAFEWDSRIGFNPEYTDQPLRFAVNFMLNQGIIPGKLRKSASKISDGALFDYEHFTTLCGHELLQAKPGKISSMGNLWKIAAVVVILCGIAGLTGYYFYSRTEPETEIEPQTVTSSPQLADTPPSELEERLSAAKTSEQRAIRERNKAANERDNALRERDTALKTIDRLQKENDELRAELDGLRKNKPKKDGVLSGALKKIGL